MAYLFEIAHKTLKATGARIVSAKLPYDPATIAAVKQIPGAKWLPNDKVWCVPVDSKPAFAAVVEAAQAREMARLAATQAPQTLAECRHRSTADYQDGKWVV